MAMNLPGPTCLCAVSAEMAGVDGAGIMCCRAPLSRSTVCSSERGERWSSRSCSSRPWARARVSTCSPVPSRSSNPTWPTPTPPAGPPSPHPPWRPESGPSSASPCWRATSASAGIESLPGRTRGARGRQLADTLVMAGVAARSVLTMQSDGASGTWPRDRGRFAPALRGAPGVGHGGRPVGGSVREALARLRAFAFATDRLDSPRWPSRPRGGPPPPASPTAVPGARGFRGR